MILHPSVAMGNEVSIDLTSVQSHLAILRIRVLHFTDLDGTTTTTTTRSWTLLLFHDVHDVLLPTAAMMTIAGILLVNDDPVTITVIRAKIGNAHYLLT